MDDLLKLLIIKEIILEDLVFFHEIIIKNYELY